MDRHAHPPREALSPVRVLWPPPGLERSQGAFSRATRPIAAGGGFLILPVLLSAGLPQAFNSLGVAGGAWWALNLLSLGGLLTVIAALGGLLGFFQSARKAAIHGIDLETILQVAADRTGDRGSRIQGTRAYRSVDEGNRLRAVRARVWASLAFLSGAVWLSVGWVLAILLASRGIIGPSGLWVLTLSPAGAIFFSGLAASAVEEISLRAAFGLFTWSRWSNLGQREAAEIWGEEIRRFRAERGESTPQGARAFLMAAATVVALGAGIAIPGTGFLVGSSIGPALASMTVPKFSATLRRAAEAEALAYLRLEADPSITPLEAGEALHVITNLDGRRAPFDGVKVAVRSYETRFLPNREENLFGMPPGKWPEILIPRVLEGLTVEEEAYLRAVAEHPGLAEFETLARAPAADFLQATYELPFAEKETVISLPIPRYSGIREGAYAMIAKAAMELQDGNPAKAESTLRTVISAGHLLADDSPTLIGSLIGFVLVSGGADALEHLYDATGREAEATAMRRTRKAVNRASEIAQQGTFRGEMESTLKGMPKTVLSKDAIRGLQWEYLHILTGVSHCINPSQMLFGPDQETTEFLQAAEANLVRYPSEKALFDLMKKGWLDLPSRGGWAGRVADATKTILGGRPGECAAILTSSVF